MCGFLLVGVIGGGAEVILVAIVLTDYAELYFEEKNVQKQQIALLFKKQIT